MTATKNLVGLVLSIVLHHDPTGQPNGGHLMAQTGRKVKTARVTNGALGPKSKADECVLVVHGTPRGLDQHMELLNSHAARHAEEVGENGTLLYTHHDMSADETNVAKQRCNQHKYFDAFDRQNTGVTIGLVGPKQMEATDKWTPCVTKMLLIGPMEEKTLDQAHGRTSRGCELVEGKRVRACPTAIIHMQSAWASQVHSLLGIRPLQETTLLDAPDWVDTRIKECRGGAYTEASLELAKRAAVKLLGVQGGGDEAKAILPGKLADLFLTLVRDSDQRAEFMKLAPENEDGEFVGEHGDYWSVVHEYAFAKEAAAEAGDEQDEAAAEDEHVTEEDLFGSDD